MTLYTTNPMNSESTMALNPRASLFHAGNAYSGLLILPAFTALVFSGNYHALWLVYDIVAMLLLFHYIASGKKRISRVQSFLLAGVIGYFLVISIVSGHLFAGVLSIWDTFKHLLYFPLIATMSRLDFSGRNTKLAQIIYRFIGFAFFVQMLVVGVQYITGVHFDDVAGTFGDGGSHAIGYISLLFITASIAFSKKMIFTLGLISATIMMNIASENAGFFVLMPMLMLSIIIAKKINIKFIFIVGAMMLFANFLLNMSFYSESSFGESIISRATGIFEIPDDFDPSARNHGRSSYLVLGSYLGGWFGQGPGAYSDIYLMQGYDSMNMIDPHIIISEASHLLAESGFTGFGLTLLIYVLFVINFFDKLVVKSFMALFFIACMFYSALLMNESHIFILLLMFYFFKMIETDAEHTFTSRPRITGLQV